MECGLVALALMSPIPCATYTQAFTELANPDDLVGLESWF